MRPPAFWQPLLWAPDDPPSPLRESDRVRAMRFVAGCAVTAVLISGCTVGGLSSPSVASSQTPVETCDREWSPQDAPELTRLWASVWSKPNTEDRLAILEQIWADDGSFVDPLLDEPVAGRGPLNDYLDGFNAAYPGYYFTLRAWTAGDLHNDRMRMRWNFCSPDDALLVEGADFGVLAGDGRLQSVASFYALPWPEPAAP